MASLIFTPEADEEIDSIYEYSLSGWGVRGYDSYRNLMIRAFEAISRNPDLPYALKFPDILESVRGLPLWLVSQPDRDLRVKNPPHIVYYRIVDDQTVEILRILHKSMNSNILLQRPSPL